MLFWCLLSLDLLLDGWGRLSRVTLSGICFGIAMLTKETAVFLLPPMLYIAWQQRWQHQARFAVVGWLVPMVVVVSWYPLYAALKGELLPAAARSQFSTSGYGNTGVSLVDSLVWQIGRGGGGPFNLDNQFWTLVSSDWLPRDAVLLVGGALATLLNLARGLRRGQSSSGGALATGLLGLLPLLYLARGGIVFDFYILVAIPFLCLNLAVLLAPLSRRLPRLAVRGLAALASLAVWSSATSHAGAAPAAVRAVAEHGGREAIAWIKAHVPADALILIRDDLWTDLREPGPGGAGLPERPELHQGGRRPGDSHRRLRDDWHNVDYLVMSPGLEQTLRRLGQHDRPAGAAQRAPGQSWTTDGSTLGALESRQGRRDRSRAADAPAAPI